MRIIHRFFFVGLFQIEQSLKTVQLLIIEIPVVLLRCNNG